MLNQDIILNDIYSKKEVNAIMALDAKIVSSNVGKYCEQNADKYSVVLNTWLYMCRQYMSMRAVGGLKRQISRLGLLAVINDCNNLASDIIASDFTLSDLGEYGFMMQEDPRITLQLLRYPKRFSPSGADKVTEKGLRDFLKLNNKLKGKPVVILNDGTVMQRDIAYPRFLIDGVSDYCHQLLWRPLLEEEPLMEGNFSNGVTALGSKTMYEKYREFCRVAPGYKDVFLYPLPRFGNEDEGYCPDIDYVKVVAVPKSYKAPRIIAEVSAYTQYHQQGIRAAAIRVLACSKYSDLIILDDQSINQEWSRLGSIYGTYCTIDLSAASDSISNHLARKVLPYSWYRITQDWNPPYIKVGRDKRARNIFLTSGSGNTFVLESVIFLSIALYATETVCRLTGEDCLPPRVYGDDLICDTRVYDTLVDFLSKLDFTVNTDKSFSKGGYRESCGAEWWCGLDTSTKYYPRKAFDEANPSVKGEYAQSLVSLQHRLYEFELCEQWLSRHIANLFIAEKWGTLRCPITSSRIGEDCSDLWADFPYYYICYPPYDHEGADATKDFLDANPDIRREHHHALVPQKTFEEEHIDALTKGFLKRFEDYYGRPYVPQDRRVCEMFRYVDFLQHGTPLDEFGIPIHRPDVSHDLLIEELSWRVTKR